jgi:hypothetical protein
MVGPEYVVEKPDADPRYFSSWSAMRSALKQELDWMRNMARSGRIPMDRVRRVIDEVESIPREGGELDLLVDPMSGLRYRVKVRRKGVPGR